MNSARQLDPLSPQRRNLRIVARCAEPLAPADPTALQTQPYRGLQLVHSIHPQQLRARQSDTLEQARRIVSLIEQEIMSRADRERSVRLRVCPPAATTPVSAAPKEPRFFSRFRSFTSSVQTHFSSR